MAVSTGLALWTVLLSSLSLKLGILAYNWKTYVEVVTQESMTDVLARLHKQYGDVIRIAPNELHFSNPSAYHDIYNASARWDKDRLLYESFGKTCSSLSFLAEPSLTCRASSDEMRVDQLTELLEKNNASGKSADLLFAFRCFTVDTVQEFCFGKSVHAMEEADFRAPLVTAMDAALPTFFIFKNFPLFRKTLLSLPPWLAVRASPKTAGLIHLQEIIGKQVRDVVSDPSSLQDAPHPTIYHRLLDPGAHRGFPVPSATYLCEEALTMVFAGGLTVADSLMTGHFHILNQHTLYEKLRAEVLTVWPNIDRPPSFEAFETLPLLTATIKESLRVSPGVSSPLLRVVPTKGANISGVSIPGGTVVGMAAPFVHQSDAIFASPSTFDPCRWLATDTKNLDKNLVAFSRGPRSCFGVNLAWCELYIAFATMLRRFEMSLDGKTEEDLKWRDCFTPYYPGRHLMVWCKPASA
ncbi:uncharacterized protein L3040_003860 [Drepanopeziza brunnea f. sp. 'multigermtubi']|uniref:uncharacterized protein n=1 Tax=Drepanopeziza brunnea f. sp. 'multigermtubi' TaxID=698441 RepID=UPI00239064B7|nr:hypothetical protein L3040_003860 [Drepanopeziza brunnea f. sp. 'multigermtubi']